MKSRFGGIFFWVFISLIVLGLVAEHANAGTYEVPGKEGWISGDLCEFWSPPVGHLELIGQCHVDDVGVAMIDEYDRIIETAKVDGDAFVEGPCDYPVNNINTSTECTVERAMGMLLRHFRDLLAFSPNAQLVETAVGELLATFGDYPMPTYGEICRMYGIALSTCTVDNVLSIMESYEKVLVRETSSSKIGVPFTGPTSPAGALAVLRFDREQLMLHAGLREPVLANSNPRIE